MSNHDLFSRPTQGGHFTGKDYTKHVKWTPVRIFLFAIGISVPYFVVVITVAKITHPFVAILLTLPVLLVDLSENL